MGKNPKIRYVAVFTLLLATHFSCVPGTKEVFRPGPEPTPVSPVSLQFIDEKIAVLTRLLQDDTVDEKDKETAEKLLEAYRTLKKAVRPSKAYDYPMITLTLFETLSDLDQKYFLKDRFGEKHYADIIDLYSQKRKAIIDGYLAGDYQGVIDGSLELENTFGSSSLTPDVGLVFSLSLANMGMLSEAVNVGTRILREMEGKPEFMHLRAGILRWQLEMGNKELAAQVFERFIDDLQEHESVFKRAEKRLTEKDEKEVLIGETADDPYSNIKTGSREPESLEELFLQVDGLVQRHEFNRAKILLLKRRIQLAEGPEVATIDRAMKTVDLAEVRYQKEERQKSQDEEILSLAMKMIEEEKFEEAIARLNDLDRSKVFQAETGELREIAVENLINRERNRAAKLFLRALREKEPDKKDALLRSSHKILKVVIETYPSSPLNDKLIDHLAKIEEELKKMKRFSE